MAASALLTVMIATGLHDRPRLVRFRRLPAGGCWPANREAEVNPTGLGQVRLAIDALELPTYLSAAVVVPSTYEMPVCAAVEYLLFARSIRSGAEPANTRGGPTLLFRHAMPGPTNCISATLQPPCGIRSCRGFQRSPVQAGVVLVREAEFDPGIPIALSLPAPASLSVKRGSVAPVAFSWTQPKPHAVTLSPS